VRKLHLASPDLTDSLVMSSIDECLLHDWLTRNHSGVRHSSPFGDGLIAFTIVDLNRC
jgi:hypothetical protein